ncbi:hypothetical protein [Streptomyces rapamycinicus]|uniref:LigA protein n=2 Tax=Streptomyces rapamycinicus TaxID=1226757 RepID=A0A0A0NL35_STRRN|nr:hypothetical protein [Streptomyces rapamycinicus]AGP56818.1 hypothetical protein M271_26725 [Streptomyces rapamycinicus NRRL 5491]MBB4784431.1 hypothetical protein [Streptomyces rapamycinicus]RLV80085.1 hypothetical protein D3C57_116910 [Streptomyces rapamycinicus NRRL 5491]UTO64741.1 hypothetical protein LJB45_22040 [Streptomyces rapamycinicus]UTP32698.1 hypothetical protein LIV37_27165 [Streptomyces rapamycinicus NRRL 5491]
MTVRAAWLLTGPPAGQTRTDTRLAPLGTFAPEGELTTRDGVIAGGAPLTATSAGPMQVQLGIGRALVQGTTAQGAYPVAVTAPETLTVADGDAQNPRVDSLVLRVYDGLFDASGQTAVAVELIKGAPEPSPSEPTLPASSLRLWSITVPAGASAGTGGINWASALADRRRYTSSYGGIIPRGWGTDFAGAYDGQYRDVDGVLERWNASAAQWETYRPPLNVETATTGFSVASGYTLNGYTARRTGGVAWFALEVVRKGAQLDVGAAGNINDETLGTIPAGWRPPADCELSVSDGFGEGTARLTTAGVLSLRTWSGEGALRNDRNLRTSATYVLA